MNSPDSPSRAAHTLVEVTIAILILGIIAAVAAPRMSSVYQAFKLESAARQLSVLIDHVRSSAIIEGQAKTIVFDNSTYAYRCSDVYFPDRIGTLIDVSLPRDFDAGFKLEANFDGGNLLSFDLEGSPLTEGLALQVGNIFLRSGDLLYCVKISSTGATTVTRPTAVETREMIDPAPGESSEGITQ